jgi:hypothetical protein
MSYGVVFSIKDEIFLLTKPDGSFLAFEDMETTVRYMSEIASKNAEVNGPFASIIFLTTVDIGLIKYPRIPKNLSRYLEDYNPETNASKLYCHGIAGVKMFGLRVKESISRLKYVPPRENKAESKPTEPESPKAASDSQDPYEKRD